MNAPEEKQPETPLDLDALRQRIDDVDQRLIDVLSERARIVVEIGRVKQGDGTPIYAPHRERAVLDKVIKANPGPLLPRTIEAIYRELMSGSFSLELPLRVAYLGPAGSFSHHAAVKQFGSSVKHAPLTQIDAVFEEVAKGRCHYGLVPYENSIGGGITETLDAFQRHKVNIYAEILIGVRQMFMANCPPDDIKRVYSKPEAFSQCRRWLNRQYPDAELIPATSSSAAVQIAAKEPGVAAIGSELAGEIYGVKPLFQDIEDNPNNVTRFLVLAREEAQRTGEDKTSIMFVTAHKPGALVDVLGVFREANINLSHIDKRPSGRTNWEYTFFIDCDGHQQDDVMAQAIEDARTHCLQLQALGSYPRAERIL